MANLRNLFTRIVYHGFVLVPSEAMCDPEARRKWNATIREAFDSAVDDAVRFLAENGLFIPKNVCFCADTATSAANAEQHNFAAFRPYVEEPQPHPMSVEDGHEL